MILCVKEPNTEDIFNGTVVQLCLCMSKAALFDRVLDPNSSLLILVASLFSSSR